MNYLAFDTSGSHLTLAVRRGEQLFTHFEKDCALKHSFTFMPAAEELLNAAGLSLKELDFIAVAAGPGSFTGIRIGVSAAKAMCFAAELPLLSITSFDVLAYNGIKREKLAVIDAGRGGFYVCPYTGYEASSPKYVLSGGLKALAEGREMICDPSAAPFGFEFTPADLLTGLVRAAEAKRDYAADPDGAEPLYVRKSQAEENRK